MDTPNYLEVTKQYYASWLSVPVSLLDQKGVHCQYSPEREEQQEGYSQQFDFYGFVSNGTTILTYSNRIKDEVEWIRQYFERHNDILGCEKAIRDKFGVKLQHNYKYYFDHLPANIDTSYVRQLTTQDYPFYLRFFQTLYPDSEVETWLKEYFDEMVKEGNVFGIYVDGEIASATDTPNMPYMKDKVVEIGINTLPDYRRKGYATAVVFALLQKIVNEQKVPIVSCLSENVASQRLAERVGFVKFADVIAFSLEFVQEAVNGG